MSLSNGDLMKAKIDLGEPVGGANLASSLADIVIIADFSRVIARFLLDYVIHQFLRNSILDGILVN